MQLCADRRALPEAFRFVRLVQPPDLRVFNMLLSTCAHAGDADAAFRAFRDLGAAGIRPDCVAYTTLVSACAKAGEVERAIEVYHDMHRVGVRPNVFTFGALMDCLSRDVKHAADTGDVKRVDARLAQCEQLQEEMRQAGVRPDGVMFNSLVSACGRAARVNPSALRAAFSALREMGELGVPASAFTFSSLIDGCTRAGEPHRGLSVWDEAVSAHPDLERTPELVGAAAHACAAVGDLDRAMALYRDSLEHGLKPDGVLYAILMDVAAKAGNPDFAFGLQEEMQRAGVAPTAAVCATLVGICAREGAPQRAKSVFRAMRAADVRPNTSSVNALVAAHARAGDLEGAFGALSELPAAGLAPDATTYATLIGACARCGDVERASKVFDRMLDARVEPPAEAFTSLVSGYAQAGQIEVALEWVARMGASGHRLDDGTARLLLGAAARCGDAEATWAVWRACRDSGLPATELALNTVLGACLRRSRALEAAAAAEGPGGASRAEKQEWERRAVGAYVEATSSGGVVPRIETLSTLLACMRQPQPRGLRRALAASAANLSRAASTALSTAHVSSENHRLSLYPERALSLFEDAQALGVVPRFTWGGPQEIDLRQLPPAAAEVCVLTLLRVLRRRRAASGDRLAAQPVRLRVHTFDELVKLSAGAAKGASLRRTQTGTRVAELLRRLNLRCATHQPCGEGGILEVPASEMAEWLAQGPQERRSVPLPGTEPRLPTDIQEQQRRIRMKGF